MTFEQYNAKEDEFWENIKSELNINIDRNLTILTFKEGYISQHKYQKIYCVKELRGKKHDYDKPTKNKLIN